MSIHLQYKLTRESMEGVSTTLLKSSNFAFARYIAVQCLSRIAIKEIISKFIEFYPLTYLLL